MTPLPLEGVRVLEASQVMAGPYCALLLADMGADVVKVEKPRGGDDSRRMGPPFINGESAAFLAINRNKRSLGLDLKQPAGQQVFRRLAQRADILVENFRPGTLDALGLGYADLSGRTPRADLLLHLWLWPNRPGSRARRLRSGGAGRRRPDEHHWTARPAAGEDRRAGGGS